MTVSDTQILEDYAPLISSWSIKCREIEDDLDHIHLIINFNDLSILSVFEKYFLDTGNLRYGYHWRTSENKTLYRWDNSPYFPDFSTYPFHRHIGEQEIAESFPKVSLEDVLIFIANQIAK